jgi:tRNA1Val (adenine37-N6)-methyltransferase
MDDPSKPASGPSHDAAPDPTPELTVEDLGPYKFFQPRLGHRLTNDPILLVDFLPELNEKDPVMDLGTGAGVIPLLLAWKTKARAITGVEVQAEEAAIARRNVEENGLQDRISILNRDFRGLPGVFPEGAFPVVISNPPYVKAGSGRVSPDKNRAAARGEVFGTLTDLVDVSRYLAGTDGRIFYIFTVLRLDEMLTELKRAGLRARRIKFVHTGPDKEARLFLIEAATTGELKVEGPVFL